MDYLAFGTYFVALVVYAGSPGPVMAVLVARSVVGNRKGALAFAAGLCLGEIIAIIAVILGIGIWAQTKPELLAIAKYAGVVYLLWLALKMWNDHCNFSSSEPGKVGLLSSTGAGVAICLGNPTTILMQMLLLPIAIPVGPIGFERAGLVVATTFVAFGVVFFGTVILARQLNRILVSPSSTSIFSRIAAGVTALTSVWILAT